MSLQNELQNLNNAVENLKRELRRSILSILGVDLKKVFEEGWNMHSVTDPFLILEKSEMERAQFDEEIRKTRCWRSVDEAWANSDSEEL